MPFIREDFILNKDGDFPLQDTVVSGVYMNTPYGDSDDQHKVDIVVYGKGWLKFSPTIGFLVKSYLNSEYKLYDVIKNLKENLEKDGYKTKTGLVLPSNKFGNNEILENGGFYIDLDRVYR